METLNAGGLGRGWDQGAGCQGGAGWRCANVYLHPRFAVMVRRNKNSNKRSRAGDTIKSPRVPGRAVIMGEISGASPPVQAVRYLATVLVTSPSNKTATADSYCG